MIKAVSWNSGEVFPFYSPPKIIAHLLNSEINSTLVIESVIANTFANYDSPVSVSEINLYSVNLVQMKNADGKMSSKYSMLEQ